MEEQELIKRAKEGNLPSFEKLISLYQKKVYNLAYRLCGNHQDAEDISQEAFIDIFKSLKDLKEISSFSSYVYRIVNTTFYDYLRKRKGQTSELKDEIVQNPLNFTENIELKEVLQKEILKLPLEFRQCLILRDVQGFSYEEISKMLKISLGTVKSRVARARNTLRERLKMGNLL